MKYPDVKRKQRALSGWPVDWSIVSCTRKVAGLIPSQNTYVGCRFSPQLGNVREATDQYFSLTLLSLSLISLSLSLLPSPFLLSLKAITMFSGKDLKKQEKEKKKIAENWQVSSIGTTYNLFLK